MESLIEKSNIARQKGRYWRKIRNLVFLAFIFGFFCWGGITYYYPHSKGVKTGKLNSLVIEGLIFKTYEGALIESKADSVMDHKNESNLFEFSIAKKKIYDKLNYVGNKTVELKYTEYFKAIPWRGQSRNVVVDIIAVFDEKEPFERELIAGEAGEK